MDLNNAIRTYKNKKNYLKIIWSWSQTVLNDFQNRHCPEKKPSLQQLGGYISTPIYNVMCYMKVFMAIFKYTAAQMQDILYINYHKRNGF